MRLAPVRWVLVLWVLETGLVARGAVAQGATMSLGWATQTGLPAWVGAADPRDAPLLAQCGRGEAALQVAARHAAERALRGLAPQDTQQLSANLRMLGEPHTRAKAWIVRAKQVARDEALARMRSWLSTLSRHEGERRCGVASVLDSEHGEALAVVVIDALADLAQPVPMQVRTGSWITVDARALVPSDGAKVIVLGPRGAPRTIPTSFEFRSRRIVARFSADVPGKWLIQVLASPASGPRPVLEVELFAGVTPYPDGDSPEAPGEKIAAGIADDADALMVMLNAARQSERVAPLMRDGRLDELAVQHARAMMRAGLLGHAVEGESPPSRIDEAGMAFAEAGENVAHAATVALAHRVIWSSPSHRRNVLHDRYRRVGVAVVRDAAGHAWVTELFAGQDAAPEGL